MKISIIIPVYNVEQYIVQCLQSVADQTWKDGEIECIVVDDCSSDGTLQVIYNYLSSYSGNIAFKVLAQDQNAGVSVARNIGLEKATGDYVYFVDSDDYLHPDCLVLLTEPLKRSRYEMIVGSYDMQGIHLMDDFICNESEIKGTDLIFQALRDLKYYYQVWNKLISIDFIRKNDLYFIPGMIHEDVVWTVFAALKMKSMYTIDKVVYHYRGRENSIITSLDKIRDTLSYVLVLAKITQFAKDNGYLYTPSVFWYIELFKRNVFNRLMELPVDKIIGCLEFSYYELKYSPINAYRNDLISFKTLLANLYMYLPKPLSCRLYYVQRRLLKSVFG